MKLQITKYVEREKEVLDEMVDKRTYSYNQISDEDYRKKYRYEENVMSVDISEAQFEAIRKEVLKVF